MPKTLLDVTPREFREFDGVPAWRYKDSKVVSSHDGTVEGWPGSHKHVFSWWVLESGHRVGWNENPGRGWSFPVLPPPKKT